MRARSVRCLAASLLVVAGALVLADARVAEASALDPTFSGDGVVDDPAPAPVIGVALAVAVASDGTILATGGSIRASNPQGFAVFRVLPDGTPDPSFGTNGEAFVPLPVANADVAFQIVAEPGGGCVVAGLDGQGDMTLVRYRNDGTAEPTFGTGGIVTLPDFFQPTGLVRDPVTGFIVVGDGEKLARLDLSGALDPTFGSGGIVTTFFSIRALVGQPDGKILVAGFRDTAPHDADVVLRRYDGVGSTDGAFGVGGTVTTAVSSQDDAVTLIALAPDGRIVLWGGTASEPASQSLLLRYLPDGELDASFGTGGVLLPTTPVVAEGLAVDPDGRIVLAGTLNPSFPFSLGSPWVARYLADGTLDATFPEPPDPISGKSGFYAVAVQPDGKIVGAGGHDLTNHSVYQIRRYLPDGFCGNTIVDPGEDCDDPEAGSCCNPDCTFTAAGVGCPSDGDDCTADVCDGAGACTHGPVPDVPITLCDDGNACSTGDHCVAGTCTPAIVFQYGTLCEVCDPASGFVARPRTDCKTTLAPHASALKIKFDTSGNDRHRLAWQWRKGEATSPAELGDPLTSGLDGLHDFCVFDESGATPSLAFATGVGTNLNEICPDGPCWRAHGDSLVFKRNPPSQLGVSKMSLRSGGDDHTRQSVQGKGTALFAPNFSFTPAPPPYPLPLRAQLWSRDGSCWEATYSPADVRTNDTGAFQAKSD